MRITPLYSCEDMCGRKPGNSGIHRLRAACRCSLPDFDRAAWDPGADSEASRDSEWRAREVVDNARSQGITLDFDLERDGCPQGWALSRYVSSVSAYVGQRDSSSPIRAGNHHMQWRITHDTVRPVRLFDAVATFEAYEDGAWAYCMAVVQG